MNFTVYSKEFCPYCDKIKQVLEHISIANKYSITIYELGTDFTRDQFLNEFGEGSTFPQVIIDGNNIGGCIDTIKYLQENNIL
jgi:glutaredoxin